MATVMATGDDDGKATMEMPAMAKTSVDNDSAITDDDGTWRRPNDRDRVF